MSLPLWERGLKSYTNAPATSAVPASLPLWERGLKSAWITVEMVQAAVAPLVGAWIEMYTSLYF